MTQHHISADVAVTDNGALFNTTYQLALACGETPEQATKRLTEDGRANPSACLKVIFGLNYVPGTRILNFGMEEVG